MANTIPDISVTSDSFVSLNSESGLVVGTALSFQNKGSTDIYIVESDTLPAATSTDGILLSQFSRDYSIGGSTVGSNEIWARSVSGTGRIHLEVGG